MSLTSPVVTEMDGLEQRALDLLNGVAGFDGGPLSCLVLGIALGIATGWLLGFWFATWLVLKVTTIDQTPTGKYLGKVDEVTRDGNGKKVHKAEPVTTESEDQP